MIVEGRRALGLTQLLLAVAAGTTDTTLHALERFDVVPRREIVDRVGGILGLDPTALLAPNPAGREATA